MSRAHAIVRQRERERGHVKHVMCKASKEVVKSESTAREALELSLSLCLCSLAAASADAEETRTDEERHTQTQKMSIILRKHEKRRRDAEDARAKEDKKKKCSLLLLPSLPSYFTGVDADSPASGTQLQERGS